MISIIITAFKEPKTISRAIHAFENQIGKKDEIILIAPDNETLNAGKQTKVKQLKTIKDQGNGKPAALNIAVKKARGEILILSDGDVYVDKNAVIEIINKFKDGIGAVSGRPISIDSKETKFGYWAYVLTEIANERRLKSILSRKRFFCSGYLFGIRKNLFPKLPTKLLSEDGYISHQVYAKGFFIEYAEKAKVYVKYPNNMKDWIIQKKRSAGGYNQINEMIGINMRSFGKESSGVLDLPKYASGLKEMIWIIELIFARIYLWIIIYRDTNIKKKDHKEIWKRVESTK